MNNDQNLKADFKDWLTHPLTKVFVQILERQKEDHLNYANEATFKSYYKKEINEHAILAYGKADGISVVLGIIDSCKSDSQVIDNLFQQAFEENDR